MALKKSDNKIKALNSAILYRDYVFTAAILLFLTCLFVVQSVSARSSVQKYNFSHEAGFIHKQQLAYFAKGKRSYNFKEYAYAARLFTILSEQGHSKSQYFLGSLYDTGLGVDASKEKAFVLYQKSAIANVRAAQHNLAVSYANGQGTEVNVAKAIYWWKKAAKSGNTDAQYNLGIIYASGHGPVEPDLKKALKWWRMAAINGDAIAQFNLGALYANGIGFSSRTCEASRWWKKSAANGFAQAKLALALLETKND